MENINYSILNAEAWINHAVSELPVGIAYYILKAKTMELQKLYYEQAQKEYAEVQAKAASSQENKEDIQDDAGNNLAPAH